MKNVKYILLAFMICMAGYAHATVRTLNNNNPSPGQYEYFNLAQAASSPGDTIYVSGSPISYGSISVTVDNLTILGTGHNPQKQNPLISMFDNISGSNVVRMKVNGVKCNRIGLTANSLGQLYVDNCFVAENVVIDALNGDAYFFLHNNILNSYLNLATTTYTRTVQGVITPGRFIRGDISNNIIIGSLHFFNNSSSTPIAEIDDCSITNNVFISYGAYTDNVFATTPKVLYNNSIFSNNILYGYIGHGLDTTSNVLSQNNMIFNFSFTPALPNSVNTLLANPLFVNYGCGLNLGCPFDPTFDFHLQPTSPAKNAGTDGTDLGVYGGPKGSSFSMSGEPPIPQIKQMNMPASVSSGQSFNVQIISTVK